MPPALALTLDRPAPRRPPKRGGPWILLGSLAAHLLVLAGLVSGVRETPQRKDPPALDVELQRPAPPQDRLTPTKPAQHPAAAVAAQPPPITAPVIASAPAAPATPTQAVAPPGFTARALTGGGDALRQAARAGIGCRNADLLALTRAERAVCDEKLGEKYKHGPAMYAVIDPAKKAAFDGACKRDDDWCLYRTGEGPYPGLFALGRKKKNVDW